MKQRTRPGAWLTAMLWILAFSRAAGQVGAPAIEWYLRPDGECPLYVVEYGVGPAVVVLHGGWGAEHSYLLDAIRPLTSDYRFVLYDQRGSLRSPCDTGTISVQDHVQDLETLRSELGEERLTLLAHSMGTFLAMSYLERRPDRTRGLVLLSSLRPRTPLGDEVELAEEEQRRFAHWRARAEVKATIEANGLAGGGLGNRERADLWRIRYAAANLHNLGRWRQTRGGRVFYNAAAGQAAARTMPTEYDFTGALGEVPNGVTVINGDHDLVGFGSALHRKMLRGIRGLRFVEIPEAAHFLWIDQPLAFLAELRVALAAAAGGQSK